MHTVYFGTMHREGAGHGAQNTKARDGYSMQKQQEHGGHGQTTGRRTGRVKLVRVRVKYISR
jgi:hypothetical protein